MARAATATEAVKRAHSIAGIPARAVSAVCCEKRSIEGVEQNSNKYNLIL